MVYLGKVYLLDCTLRDGGYINDWKFGKETIRGFCKKIAYTGVEMLEIGFLKGKQFDEDSTLFPDTKCMQKVMQPKQKNLLYAAMLDMSDPVSLDCIFPYDGNSIDVIRVIFKKDKMDEAYEYCNAIQRLGYKVAVNLVGTDQYSDTEFVETIQHFNEIDPYIISIVDSFGLIKRKQFLRLAYLADHNMKADIILGYHAHNNLQQAFGNAEALAELNLQRKVCVDACVFGMGRGAGNLNLELFAEYMNENFNTKYQIEPMLEIMDEYLNEIYQKRSWGYSLPFYLSASTGCHPNYAIYFAEKDTLPVKAFHELLNQISEEDRIRFSIEKAEKYYREYQENYIDDQMVINKLEDLFTDREVLLLAPGKTLVQNKKIICDKIEQDKLVVIAVNFEGNEFPVDYIFSSNMRRFTKIHRNAKYITTSNMKDCTSSTYVVNFSSYSSKYPEIIDNSGIMLLKLLSVIGVNKVYIAGMDGYSPDRKQSYYDSRLEYDFSGVAMKRNELIAKEIREIKQRMDVEFLTPTQYDICQ